MNRYEEDFNFSFYKTLVVIESSFSFRNMCWVFPETGFHSLSMLSNDVACEYLFSVLLCSGFRTLSLFWRTPYTWELVFLSPYLIIHRSYPGHLCFILSISCFLCRTRHFISQYRSGGMWKCLYRSTHIDKKRTGTFSFVLFTFISVGTFSFFLFTNTITTECGCCVFIITIKKGIRCKWSCAIRYA